MTEVELRYWLTEVAVRLEAGQLRHAAGVTQPWKIDAGEWFHMAWWDTGSFDNVDCGTASCIGGWVERLSGKRMQFIHDSSPLNDLFYPDYELFPEYYVITAEMAARAIRNYLDYGRPKWEEIKNG